MTRYEVTIAGYVFRVVAPTEHMARLKAADEYLFETGRRARHLVVYDLDDEAEYWASLEEDR